MSNYAKIVTLEEFEQVRGSLGRIVCASGGFDPIHPGHTTYLIESKKYGDTLVVFVNGDNFLTAKKGRPFMNLKTRCMIVSSIRNVDYVIPFEIQQDQTVCEALRRIRPSVFTKGGDRTDPNKIPEWEVCQELGIEIILGVGSERDFRSSDILKKWGEFWMLSHQK